MPRSGNGARRHTSLPRLWWAALLYLAMLAGFPPEAKSQNSLAILQYKTSHTFSRIAAVVMTARRVGDTSQPLTVSSRVKGKPDNPSLDRFKVADHGDFDLSKTAQSLILAARSTDAQSINLQTSHATAHELEERFEVVASGNHGAAAFDAGLDGIFIEDGPPTVDRVHTDPFRIEESDTGTVRFSTSFPVPHPVIVRHSLKSRQRTFTETLGAATTVADHKVDRGTVTISADGDTARLDTQIVSESQEQFVIKLYGHSTAPAYRPVSTFTTSGDGRIRTSATIRSGQQSSSVPQQINDDSIDDRYYALSTIHITDAPGCWSCGAVTGYSRRLGGVTQGNDETPANLLGA